MGPSPLDYAIALVIAAGIGAAAYAIGWPYGLIVPAVPIAVAIVVCVCVIIRDGL